MSVVLNDLKRAERIQALSLSTIFPRMPACGSPRSTRPHDIVGGDFYAIRQLDADQYGFVLGRRDGPRRCRRPPYHAPLCSGSGERPPPSHTSRGARCGDQQRSGEGCQGRVVCHGDLRGDRRQDETLRLLSAGGPLTLSCILRALSKRWSRRLPVRDDGRRLIRRSNGPASCRKTASCRSAMAVEHPQRQR